MFAKVGHDKTILLKGLHIVDLHSITAVCLKLKSSLFASNPHWSHWVSNYGIADNNTTDIFLESCSLLLTLTMCRNISIKYLFGQQHIQQGTPKPTRSQTDQKFVKVTVIRHGLPLLNKHVSLIAFVIQCFCTICTCPRTTNNRNWRVISQTHKLPAWTAADLSEPINMKSPGRLASSSADNWAPFNFLSRRCWTCRSFFSTFRRSFWLFFPSLVHPKNLPSVSQCFLNCFLFLHLV